MPLCGLEGGWPGKPDIFISTAESFEDAGLGHLWGACKHQALQAILYNLLKWERRIDKLMPRNKCNLHSTYRGGIDWSFKKQHPTNKNHSNQSKHYIGERSRFHILASFCWAWHYYKTWEFYIFLHYLLPPFLRSCRISFLHPVLNKTCTHFAPMFLLGASLFYVQ